MRIALAIYVSLAGACLAGGPAPEPNAPEWMAIYYAGMTAGEHYRNAEAISFFQRSWETAVTPDEKGASAGSLGALYREMGRTNDARAWLRRAVDSLGGDPRSGAISAAMLADLDRNAGDFAGAEQALRAALKHPPSDRAMQAELQTDLGVILRETGRTVEAKELFERSIAMEAIPARQRGAALTGLADIERGDGEFEAGIAHWNEALEITRQEGDRLSEAVVTLGLARTWLQAGNDARAEPLLKRASWMMESNPATPAEETADAHAGMGELYRRENKLSMAEEEWSQALAIDSRALGEGHPQAATVMEMLADAASAQGNFDEARNYDARATGIMSRSFGNDSMAVAAALANTAVVEQRAGDLKTAAKDYEQALEIARRHPENPALKAVMAHRYAGLLKAMHRTHEAKALLAQSDGSTMSFRRE